MNVPCRMLMTLSTPQTSEKPDGDAGVEPAEDQAVRQDLQIDHRVDYRSEMLERRGRRASQRQCCRAA